MNVRDRTADHDRAEREADDWIGSYSWSQQAGVPPDFNKIFRAMWIHGYMAGLDAARATASAAGCPMSDIVERLRELLREAADREREVWGMTDFVRRAEAALGAAVQPKAAPCDHPAGATWPTDDGWRCADCGYQHKDAAQEGEA